MGAASSCAGIAIGIAGAGRVGQALGRLLYLRGEPVVAVASRSDAHAREAAAFIGPDVAAVDFAGLPEHARRILICVPDAAIAGVSRQLGMHDGIVLHTSGALGAEVLDLPAAVARGTLHPLQTIAGPREGVEALEGIAYAVSGDSLAAAWAGSIAALAHGRVLHIASGNRTLYHAGAVMASNYVVALLDAARSILEAAGVEPSAALGAVAPLARASLENTLRSGPDAALTGPVERGDTPTVAAHLAALEAVSAPLARLYCAAGLQALAIARRRGLDAEQGAAIEQLLQGRMD